MKTVNKVCYFLAAIASLAAVVLFFTDFATIVSEKFGSLSFSGAQLGFGSDLTEPEVVMAKSSKLLFCFLMTAISFVCSIFAYKSKGAKFAAPGFGIVAAVFMLVVSLSQPIKFVDADGIANVTTVTGINYEITLYITTAVLFASVILAVAHLLINDRIECEKDKNKLTIPKRIVLFLRDYKSEFKKIVWPSFSDVVKNTVIVLIMCVIIGIFIWVVDFGLAELLKLIWAA